MALLRAPPEYSEASLRKRPQRLGQKWITFKLFEAGRPLQLYRSLKEVGFDSMGFFKIKVLSKNHTRVRNDVSSVEGVHSPVTPSEDSRFTAAGKWSQKFKPPNCSPL